MSYLSICITGIDGTGKSTIANMVCKLFQDDECVMQYMGLKNWETRFAKYCCDKKSFIIRKFQPFAVMHELRYRVSKYYNTDKVVVFDRYALEQYLEYKSRPQTIRNKFITRLYEKNLKTNIYKPTITFYLTCDIDVSIARKDDIVSNYDIERLKEMKTIMDSYYKCDDNAIIVDTSELSIEDTLQYIKGKLGEFECFSILMS